jgi:REP element-mobilizing transposase RayT
MSSPRPPRLRSFAYVGLHRYFLTILTFDHHRAFTSPTVVDPVRAHLLCAARDQQFAVPAHCFMPDHFHALVEGQADCADFQRFVRLFKQLSGYGYQQAFSARLWSPGYFDHVLRNDEATLVIARYVVENPVRAGLVKRIEEYPFSGWSGFEIADLYWPPV